MKRLVAELSLDKQILQDMPALTRAILALASEYGRYGDRRIAVKLREAGWTVGKNRVEGIWRREGLKIPQK